LTLLSVPRLPSAREATKPSNTHQYEDSAAGLQQQFTDIGQASRSGDETDLQAAIHSLGIPNSENWIRTHFIAWQVVKLQQDYSKAISGFQSHVSWVMGNFAKFPDFGLKVENSETPPPLREGFESLLPRPLGTLKVENFRFTSTSPDAKHGPPSWVSSFIYLDGQFRFVGGTYPFWAEGLNGMRGPMSVAPTTIHGMIVQAMAYQHDSVGNGIIAVVQLKVSVDRKGRVSHIDVVSGEPDYVNDAKEYMKNADFGPLPDVPQLRNARREWDMEVAFFKPRN
jgi:hypothetical protein